MRDRRRELSVREELSRRRAISVAWWLAEKRFVAREGRRPTLPELIDERLKEGNS